MSIKYGDIIELGRHRLMCGDATSREDVMGLIDGEKVDLVLTDPPYGIRILGNSWETHCCTHPDIPHGTHDGSLASGSSTVFVNGRPLGRVGDIVFCGSTVASIKEQAAKLGVSDYDSF